MWTTRQGGAVRLKSTSADVDESLLTTAMAIRDLRLWRDQLEDQTIELGATSVCPRSDGLKEMGPDVDDCRTQDQPGQDHEEGR